ncbi:helix-turn-helix transcriptional regulator (plasmid) [Pantoea sp. BJ2]|uniref:Helix-turn-helix transcriptional regulator n=1 Tax=Pantoea sp. BJ2 TaxID=3141322 RepID=A0AAU7U3M5_9GAMM
MHDEQRTEQVFVAGTDNVINVPVESTPPHCNWHRADILCAIRKAGSSLSALSREAGLSSSSLSNVFYRPWPRAERIIAEFLDKDPAEIWPERYR